MTPPSHRPPSLWLSAALGYCLVAIALAVALALQMPWLGLRLAPGPEDAVTITHSATPTVAAGGRLLGIGAPEQPAAAPLLDAPAMAPIFPLTAEDLMEEPDMLESFARMDGFFARQSQFADVLRGPQVALWWQPRHGAPQTTLATPRERPVSSLPLLFWFQLAVSTAGCLIA